MSLLAEGLTEVAPCARDIGGLWRCRRRDARGGRRQAELESTAPGEIELAKRKLIDTDPQEAV